MQNSCIKDIIEETDSTMNNISEHLENIKYNTDDKDSKYIPKGFFKKDIFAQEYTEAYAKAYKKIQAKAYAKASSEAHAEAYGEYYARCYAKGYADGYIKTYAESYVEEKYIIIKNMMEYGMDDETINKIAKLTMDEIIEIRQSTEKNKAQLIQKIKTRLLGLNS
ncbi:hypothetical protein [Succinivibrio dextrinosolvens]|uniref:hypothetical protein n=1 Tax=Succinivibrio dextrinosolvens TaxID=83771 RepID=UPI00192090B3|nr:hypothetical protein [Succinivibrio dextrinosolvens]